MLNYDYVIIGGGAAGIATAQRLYEFLPQSKIALFERDSSLGGILQQCFHTGFGLEYFQKELSGPEYASLLKEKIRTTNIDIYLNCSVTEILPSKSIIFSNKDKKNEAVKFKKLILATGSREIPFGALGIPSERPAGIFGAGEAQFLINRMGLMPGKKAVILGAGDIGLIMARRLIFEGMETCAIIELRDKPGGVERNIQTCVKDFDIPLYTSSTIVQVHGKDRVSGITFAPVTQNLRPDFSKQTYIECDTLLTSVGLTPEIDLCNNLPVKRLNSSIQTNYNGQTSLPWLYICGNASSIHPIVDKVSLEGEKVALGIIDEQNSTKE